MRKRGEFISFDDHEELKRIPGYSEYYIDIHGNCYTSNNNRHGKLRDGKLMRMKGCGGDNGRRSFQLRKHLITTARILLLTFVGPPPEEGMLACHGPAGMKDDTLSNIYWGTASRNNLEDKIRDGTLQRGEINRRAKVTEKDVREIRALRGKLTETEIGRRYGVGQTTISAIQTGQNWAWLE